MKILSQSSLLADQIHRAFEGVAWHGDPVLEMLADVKAKTAAARPIKGAHSIWELVLHIAVWDDDTIRRAHGKDVAVSDEENFPTITDTSDAAWRKAVDHMKQTHGQLIKTVAAFPAPPARAGAWQKEKYYDFYYLFSGIVQHELYHAGQIALLKKNG